MKFRNFSWGIGGFLILYQALLLISLPFYFMHQTPSLSLVFLSAALLFIIGTSVTAGYHRYFSHRTYKAKPVVESVLLLLGAMAIQSSALRWSNDHRLHHAHVDTDKDPYSIKKGFWYAHFLWLLEKPLPIEPKTVSDLENNPRVMFQHKYIVPIMFGSNALLWLLVGWIFNDYLGSFVIAICLRIFVLHHLTWFINSLAHTWGSKPFDQEQTAVNSAVLCLLTFGEGYHNYHHTFAKDYRNGVRWFHFDPTKWLIWTLEKCGLARDLRRMDKLAIKKRMVLERKSLLMDKLTVLWHEKKEDLENKVHEISERMVETITHYKTLHEELKKLKKQERKSDAIAKVKAEIAQLRQKLKNDWKQWRRLSKSILQLKAQPA